MKKYLISLVFILQTPHPAPLYIAETENGFEGHLEDGTYWQQVLVHEDEPRMMKFIIEDVFWYITEEGTFHANSDLEALSKYWTL